ncbi:hypothetical protein GCM10023149_09360 [Mucilaginibacter gynuensis]|uniref:Major fimbrial subunit protein N-terminal domain-containing protein n=2 Tax=Mucilaginibacter gynuensis TaxID=1302236 RepID=A0ABP8FYW4_9SPHI
MKPYLKSFIILLLAVSSVIVSSCKKDNDPPNEDPPPGEEPVEVKDSLITVKTNVSDVDTLLSIYKHDKSGLEFYFYGRRNSEGEIVTLAAASITKNAANDTILNVIYDAQQRPKILYFTIKGIVRAVNDYNYVTIDYMPDHLLVHLNYLNWTSGHISLINNIKIRKDGDAYTLYGLGGSKPINTETPGYSETHIIANAISVTKGLKAIIAASFTSEGFMTGTTTGNPELKKFASFWTGAFVAYNSGAKTSEIAKQFDGYPCRPTLEKFVITPIHQVIALTGEEVSQFEIVTIGPNDAGTYNFQFDGVWQHPLFGIQNNVGEYITPGPVRGNIYIVVIVQSLADGSVLPWKYYSRGVIKVTQKNVRVICSPKDMNSPIRLLEGQIPASDLTSVPGRLAMTATYFVTK